MLRPFRALRRNPLVSQGGTPRLPPLRLPWADMCCPFRAFPTHRRDLVGHPEVLHSVPPTRLVCRRDGSDFWRSSAPKGRNRPAQGKSSEQSERRRRPGFTSSKNRSPERAQQNRIDRKLCCALSGLCVGILWYPRAALRGYHRSVCPGLICVALSGHSQRIAAIW